MKIGIVIANNDAETIWNAFRFGVTALGNGNEVKVFLLGKGVDSEIISHPQFDISKMMSRLMEKGGEILACGTCLKLRKREPKVCLFSSMADMLQLVEESDKVLTF